MTAESDTRAPARYVFAPSFGQERLWLLSQLEPDSDIAYNVRTAVAIDGPLDRLVLQQALDAVIARHEGLRTGIALVDGEPKQVVLPHAALAIPVLERHAGTPEQERAAVVEQLDRQACRRFALDDPPLLRVSLLEFAPERHVLLVVLHHIVCDGWSIGVFLADLADAYERIGRGAAPRGETAIQYADFAAWQRQTVRGERLAELSEYWRDQLTGLEPLEIPTDRPRPPVRGARGATCRTRLPARLVEAVTTLAGRHDATPFMVLLTAFAVLLARRGGQSDLSVGTAVANRTRREVGDVLGLFINTLVLRTRLPDGISFAALLREVRETCLGAYAHQDLPFEKVVEALRPVRDLSRTPLFQAMFLLQNTPAEPITVDRLTFTPLPVDPGTTKYDLTLEATPDGQDLDLALHHSADLFDRSTAERMLRQYTLLVEGAVTDPGRDVFDLDLLDDADRRLLGGWALGPVRERPELSLLDLVRVCAARTPDAVAVDSPGGTLGYAALLDRVDGLARHLRAAGVRPGETVGVCVERSASLVVALLGVLASGAAYVPIDPGYPAERIGHMLADARVRLVLSTAATADRLPPGTDPVLLDHLGDPPAVDLPAADPDGIAYVIYTSGSTGRPKGVQVGHRSLVNVVLAIGDELGAAPGDVLAAVASVSFDIAALELFLPLVTGGRTVVVPEHELADGPLLAQRVAGATIMQATPATWRLLLLAGWRPRPDLRLLSTGEALDGDLAERLLADGGRLWNLYGPTETTLYASVGRVRDAGRIGLGEPVANTVRHLLDGGLRPVPVGAVGELYLGGVALGHGYLGQSGLTAARFLPDPFATRAGARMYRTSDLCRYRADGTLEYLGRADQQIKVRGVRIEPGEIESVLARHDAVAQAAVVARRVSAVDVRLVAFVVPHAATDSEGSLVDELRELARRELPTHLVPTGYAVLAALPLTRSGKVDRAALRRESQTLGVRALDETPPRTELEARIAALFAEVLGVESVGVHAGFFDLGGHSLLAAKFAARLRAETGVTLQLRDLFQGPTVAAVAAAVSTGQVTSEAAREDAALRELLANLPDAEVDALLRSAGGPPSSVSDNEFDERRDT